MSDIKHVCDIRNCPNAVKFMYPDDTAATHGISVCTVHAESFESIKRFASRQGMLDAAELVDTCCVCGACLIEQSAPYCEDSHECNNEENGEHPKLAAVIRAAAEKGGG